MSRSAPPNPTAAGSRRRRPARTLGLPIAAALAGILAVATAASSPAADEGAAEPALLRWTSTAGSTVEARLVDRRGDRITLETADGRRLTLRIDQLDPPSRTQLEATPATPSGAPGTDSTAPATGAGETESDGGGSWLPTFADGPGEGFHAVFQAEHFEAFVTRNGTVRLFLKHEGRRTSDRYIHLIPSLGYTLVGEWHGRPILSAESPLPPQRQPDRLTLEGTAEDGVTWEFTCEFREDGVSAWASADDPRDIERPTICQVVTTLPKYIDLDYTLPEETIRAAVGDGFLAVERDRGPDLRFNYHDRQLLGRAVQGPEVEGRSTAAEVGCTFFGPRIVRWEPADLDRGSLRFHNNGNAALFEGYTIFFRNRDASESSRRSRLEITVR